MPSRQQPRSIARELALLSLSQITSNTEKLEQEELDGLLLAAIRTLTAEVQDILETASAEVERGGDRIRNSDRATDVSAAGAMVRDALELSQTAINRLGIAIELPEFVQISNQQQVREYALELVTTVYGKRETIQAEIEAVLVAWQYSRLPRIDRDILRIATAEILFLDTPQKVAIDEAVELAKRYSDSDGYRFINGVLRRLSDRLQAQAQS